MNVPKRNSEIIIGPLDTHPALGIFFEIVCDEDLHDAIEEMPGVGHVNSLNNGLVWVYIDPRYTAHEVYVYVASEVTRLAKEAKLTREAEEVIDSV